MRGRHLLVALVALASVALPLSGQGALHDHPVPGRRVPESG